MKFNNIEINIQDFNKIGLRISGGADSAILLQLLCETITAERKPGQAHIQPFTVNLDIKPWNPYYVDQVLDFTKEKYPDIDIRPLISAPCTEETYVTAQAQIELDNPDLFEIVFGGVTSNPLESDTDWGYIYGNSVWEMRSKNRDQDKERRLYYWHRERKHWKSYPFRKTDKKGIAALYDLLIVRNSLFPLTRSCEGTAKETNFFDYQCGKCWWCKERIYGFGSLE